MLDKREVLEEMKVKLIVFGANGAIGKHLVQMALENGHSITAFVRRPDVLEMTHPNLQVLVGDITDKATLKQAIEGQDAVVSTLGPALSISRKVESLPISEAHQAIISVMEETAVKRFITLATPTIGSKEDLKQVVTILPSKMAKILYPTGYAEMKAIEKIILESLLDWTVVRIINPNVKTDGNGYAVTFGDTKGKMNVSRKNIAKCMLEAVSKNEWIGKMPIVYNK